MLHGRRCVSPCNRCAICYDSKMNFVKPNQLSNVIGITTDALRKQRIRGTSPYEYEVIGGRVLYEFDTLPPSVRKNIEENTTKKTRRKHAEIKDFRYWNSIGKRNEQRIKLAKKKREPEPRAVFQEQPSPNRAPRIIKHYGHIFDPRYSIPNWRPLDQVKKKKVEPFY